MAEEGLESGDDRTEEATPERREEFRERGQIAVSREISSVAALLAGVLVLAYFSTHAISALGRVTLSYFNRAVDTEITSRNIGTILGEAWASAWIIVLPIFGATLIASIAATFAQTRLNWSWEKLQPDFSRLDPLKGVVRIFSSQSLAELIKSVAKMCAVGGVAYSILSSQWKLVPGLLNMAIFDSWGYWGAISLRLAWSVIGLMVIVAGADYFYSFFTTEQRMKMTKRELKEDYKKREVDPMVKNRLRRMQRELINKKVLEATKGATVLVTNPTHYAVAMKYEMGMAAPILTAKGVDFLAQRMKEIAKEHDIPIVENKPLARTIYKVVEVGQEIPESLYKAMVEIIRYVFRLKGIPMSKKAAGGMN